MLIRQLEVRSEIFLQNVDTEIPTQEYFPLSIAAVS
jgi:hypothetical protein